MNSNSKQLVVIILVSNFPVEITIGGIFQKSGNLKDLPPSLAPIIRDSEDQKLILFFLEGSNASGNSKKLSTNGSIRGKKIMGKLATNKTMLRTNKTFKEDVSVNGGAGAATPSM